MRQFLFSPAWDAVKLTLPGGWLHLSFRGHRPYRFRSDDGSCSELAPGLMFDKFLPIPDAESLPFYPSVLKLVVWPSLFPIPCPRADTRRSRCRQADSDRDDSATLRRRRNRRATRDRAGRGRPSTGITAPFIADILTIGAP